MEGSSLNCGWRGIPCCPEVHWDYQVNWDVLSLISWIGRSFNQILNQQILTTPTFGHNFMESIWSKAWIEIPIRNIPPVPIKIHSFQKRTEKTWILTCFWTILIYCVWRDFGLSCFEHFHFQETSRKGLKKWDFCCSFKCVSYIVENFVGYKKILIWL